MYRYLCAFTVLSKFTLHYSSPKAITLSTASSRQLDGNGQKKKSINSTSANWMHKSYPKQLVPHLDRKWLQKWMKNRNKINSGLRHFRERERKKKLIFDMRLLIVPPMKPSYLAMTHHGGSYLLLHVFWFDEKTKIIASHRTHRIPKSFCSFVFVWNSWLIFNCLLNSNEKWKLYVAQFTMF